MATTRLMTIEDLERLPDDGQHYELIDGELLTMPPTGEEHNASSLSLLRQFLAYVDETGIGQLYIATQGFVLRRDPDTVLEPDIAIVIADRLRPPEERKGYVPGSPDFVVEIVSPTDRRGKIERKIRTYLDAGVRLLWLVDPIRRRVTVYRPGYEPIEYSDDDVLDGHDVLPGLSIPVARAFR
jgi:Uma2 family endonuclease